MVSLIAGCSFMTVKLLLDSLFKSFVLLFAMKKATLKEGEIDDGLNLDDEVGFITFLV